MPDYDRQQVTDNRWPPFCHLVVVAAIPTVLSALVAPFVGRAWAAENTAGLQPMIRIERAAFHPAEFLARGLCT